MFNAMFNAMFNFSRVWSMVSRFVRRTTFRQCARLATVPTAIRTRAREALLRTRIEFANTAWVIKEATRHWSRGTHRTAIAARRMGWVAGLILCTGWGVAVPAQSPDATEVGETTEVVGATESGDLAGRLPPGAVCRLGQPADSNWSHGVYGTTFSLDEQVAAIRSSDQIVRLWEIPTGKKLLDFEEVMDGRIRDFVFTDDGKFLATAIETDGNNGAMLWDVATGKRADSLSLPASFLVRRSVHPGRLLFVGHAACALCGLPGAEEPPRITSFPSSGLNSRPVAVSPDQKSMLIGRSVNAVPVRTGNRISPPSFALDVVGADRRSVTQLVPFQNTVRKCAWSPKGSMIVAICRDENRVYFRDVMRPEIASFRSGHTDSLQDVTFSPDGRHVVSVALDGKLRVWETLTQDVVVEIDEGDSRRLVSVDFSPSGRYLATGSAGRKDNSALVWDWERLLKEHVEEADVLSPWTVLAEQSPKVAYAAMQQMLETPDQTMNWMGQEFGLEKNAIAKDEIARLIRQLDDPSYTVRTAAENSLRKVRIMAASDLQAVIDRGLASLETEVRIKRILSAASESLPYGQNERLQLLRAVYVLERIASPRARETLELIAKGHSFVEVREAASDSASRLRARGN